jgi:threonine dehydratase
MLVGETCDDEHNTSPLLVMAGDTLMVDEIVGQLCSNVVPTHIVLQTGVGGLSAAVIAGASRGWAFAFPRIVTVEPQRAACGPAASADTLGVRLGADRRSATSNIWFLTSLAGHFESLPFHQ